jgi:hypothetical protein
MIARPDCFMRVPKARASGGAQRRWRPRSRRRRGPSPSATLRPQTAKVGSRQAPLPLLIRRDGKRGQSDSQCRSERRRDDRALPRRPFVPDVHDEDGGSDDPARRLKHGRSSRQGQRNREVEDPSREHDWQPWTALRPVHLNVSAVHPGAATALAEVILRPWR